MAGDARRDAGTGGTVETEAVDEEKVYLLISVIGGNDKITAIIKLQPDTAAVVLDDLADDPRAGPGVLLNRHEVNIRKSERMLQPHEGPFKYLLKHEDRKSKARPVDDTSRYMRELLLPPLDKPPPFEELPAFINSPLKSKLVCQDCDYDATTPLSARAKELLLPQSEAPTAQVLARVVSSVLNSRLRNVQGENTLHHEIDTLFVDMFRLAANATLLVFDHERNTGDSRSGSTGAGLRPDLLVWVKNALLFKGEEKKTANEIAQAVSEIMTKMTSTWDDKVYGPCPYMFAYALAGNILQIHAVQGGQQLLLLEADMSVIEGKLKALVAVVNIMRVLCAMSAILPHITWGVGQQLTREEGDVIISIVTREADYVRKELKHFEKYHSKYATLKFLQSSYQAITAAATRGGADHLVHAKTQPELQGKHLIVETVPVGVAYGTSFMPSTEDAKLVIGGAMRGCGELHALRIVHRDPRWPNIITGTINGQKYIKIIDYEMAGVLGAVCLGGPYPLPHWVYRDGSGRTVLESDNTYSARSDLKMIGKELMGPLRRLGRLDDGGKDLMDRLEAGDYQSAAEALEHAWFK